MGVNCCGKVRACVEKGESCLLTARRVGAGHLLVMHANISVRINFCLTVMSSCNTFYVVEFTVGAGDMYM